MNAKVLQFPTKIDLAVFAQNECLQLLLEELPTHITLKHPTAKWRALFEGVQVNAGVDDFYTTESWGATPPLAIQDYANQVSGHTLAWLRGRTVIRQSAPLLSYRNDAQLEALAMQRGIIARHALCVNPFISVRKWYDVRPLAASAWVVLAFLGVHTKVSRMSLRQRIKK